MYKDVVPLGLSGACIREGGREGNMQNVNSYCNIPQNLIFAFLPMACFALGT